MDPIFLGYLATLAKVGYANWKKREDSRDALAGVLLHLKTEIIRNYVSLNRAFQGSLVEVVESTAWDASDGAVGGCLAGHAGMYDALQNAYTPIVGGLQAQLAAPADGVTRAKLIGQAIRASGTAFVRINRFLRDEGLRWNEFSESDCGPLELDELMEGWSRFERAQTMRKWQEFVEAVEKDPQRLVRQEEPDENTDVSLFADPTREATLKAEAYERWGRNHAFELAEGIYEYTVEEGLRILFAMLDGRPKALVIALLIGPLDEAWTPLGYVQLAQCRAQSLTSARYLA